jgi:hypothetical protein
VTLVAVPGNVLFIADDAFPVDCILTLIGGLSNAAFRE